jgi:hypothetical protein
VHAENSWDLCACTQKPDESLRDFIRRFSKRCTELPSVAQSEIVHAFFEGTTCRDLVRELGRSPPVDSSELFDIATIFASSEEAVGAIFDGKKGKCGRHAHGGQQVQRAPQKHKRGKKCKKPSHEARARRGAMTTGTRPSLSTQLEGVLKRPLEALAYSTTC